MGESSFEVVGDVACFRASGEHKFVDGVHLVTDAILQAKSLGLGKLLVDILDISGVVPPSVEMRLWMMGEWANAGRGYVRLAIVTRREFMSEERFGVAFGMNQGFISNLFDTREQGMAWLTGHHAADPSASGSADA